MQTLTPRPGESPAAAGAPGSSEAPAGRSRRLVLYGASAAMLVIVAFLAWAVIFRSPSPPAAAANGPAAGSNAAAAAKAPRVIQLDVQNGCGAKGAAAKFTSFLRTSGFDVVEM